MVSTWLLPTAFTIKPFDSPICVVANSRIESPCVQDQFLLWRDIYIFGPVLAMTCEFKYRRLFGSQYAVIVSDDPLSMWCNSLPL